MTTILLVPANIQGQPCGEHSHRARFSDATVERARKLRAEGWTFQAIADEIGASRPTIYDWVLFRRRKSPVRMVARRVNVKKSHTSDLESPMVQAKSMTYSTVRNPTSTQPFEVDDFIDLA